MLLSSILAAIALISSTPSVSAAINLCQTLGLSEGSFVCAASTTYSYCTNGVPSAFLAINCAAGTVCCQASGMCDWPGSCAGPVLDNPVFPEQQQQQGPSPQYVPPPPQPLVYAGGGAVVWDGRQNNYNYNDAPAQPQPQQYNQAPHYGPPVVQTPPPNPWYEPIPVNYGYGEPTRTYHPWHHHPHHTTTCTTSKKIYSVHHPHHYKKPWTKRTWHYKHKKTTTTTQPKPTAKYHHHKKHLKEGYGGERWEHAGYGENQDSNDWPNARLGGNAQQVYKNLERPAPTNAQGGQLAQVWGVYPLNENSDQGGDKP
ncbi:hypothetical protein BC830DRAFT_1114288 [Chytriomyces sp. MP71]|nr:hypothetical protein BC830DRAFT_1114288 [Chytriomyces sp. MP71]